MFQLPAYSRQFSLYLSRTLDEVGLSERTVTRRRRLHLQMETKSNLLHIGLEGKKRSQFNFGSQTEGTTTPGLNSDLDNLYCHNVFHIIQDWSEWEQGRETLLMLQDGDVAPGYCRLQLVFRDAPIAATEVPPVRGMVYDNYGRVLVTNAIIHDKMLNNPKMQRSGPASTRTGMDGQLDDDTVLAFKSDSWSYGSLGWIGRQRLGHWPTPEMVEYCLDSGVFLVPVGHRLSDSESLEWRISPSLSERCLMFSMNITQIKCYVTVKLLMKTYVTPNVGKTISSFHCKTAMFYCIENTEPGLWTQENLLKCVTVCLYTLLQWVTCGYCPQFFNPEENLFAGKIKPEVQGQLIAIIRRLINSKGACLLKVQYDDLGKLLLEKLTTLPSTELFNSYWTAGMFGEFVMRGKYHSAMAHKYVLNHFAGQHTMDAINTVRKFIAKLREYLKEHEQSEDAVRELLPYMYTTLASLVSSQLLSSGKNITREVIQMFKWGNQSDLASSRLKLASVYYCSGELTKAARILTTVEKRLARRTFLPVCGCRGKPHSPVPAIVFKWLESIIDYQERSLIAHCVVFSPQEMHCIPKGLSNEMNRAFGDGELPRRTRADRWMNWAVVDSLPFLHYLQYLTYEQLSDQGMKEQALQKLVRTLGGEQDLCHRETALNLIGKCMEMESLPDAAINYYRMSLKVAPSNNAANWHMQNLSDQNKTPGTNISHAWNGGAFGNQRGSGKPPEACLLS